MAYQVIGDAALDLVVIRGSLSELASAWDQPLFVRHIGGLASFARVIMFDKRGMGLSDRLREVPTPEARMDDVRAVMDDAGVDQVAMFAAHEGARIAILFAATYPERVRALALHDPSARGKSSPAYPWAPSDDQWRHELRDVAEGWGAVDFFERRLCRDNPTVCNDADFKRWYIRHMQQSASPGAALAFHRIVMEGDVIDVLPAIRVPTLVLHRASMAGPAKFVASRIPGAVRREIPRLEDAYSWANPDANAVLLDETKSFIQRLGEAAPRERVLATILFTDIVGSTEFVAKLGDMKWKEILGRHNALVRRKLARYRGEELDTMGDGFLARFDGPGRAIRSACEIRDEVRLLDLEIRAGLHTGELNSTGETSAGSACIRRRGSPRRQVRGRSSSPARSRISSPVRASSSKIEANTTSRAFLASGVCLPSGEPPSRTLRRWDRSQDSVGYGTSRQSGWQSVQLPPPTRTIRPRLRSSTWRVVRFADASLTHLTIVRGTVQAWATISRCDYTLVNCGRALIHSRDGGETWTRTKTALLNPEFATPSRGWVSTGEARDLGRYAPWAITTDGRTWTLERGPCGGSTNMLVDVSFLTPTHGWVFCAASEPGAGAFQFKSVLRTVDGGRTWDPTAELTLDKSDVGGGGLYANGQGVGLQFLSETLGWLWTGGGHSQLAQTTNGGRTWLTIQTDGGGGFRETVSMWWVDELRGYWLRWNSASGWSLR